jgi:hypothetical protein
MARLVLGVVGGIAGSFIGMPQLGAFIGTELGGLIDNELNPQKVKGPRLSDLNVQISSYGKAIARLFGPENRVSGNMIWTSNLIETSHEEDSGGLSGKGGPSVQTTNYTYRVSLAVLLGAGARSPTDLRGCIKGIRKVWANAVLIYDADAPGQSDGNTDPQGFIDGEALDFGAGAGTTHAVFDTITVYPGDFTQNPDPTIESFKGAGNAAAYRGSAYVVIKDLQLADYGNRIPNLEFLVVADDEITVGGIAAQIVADCGIPENMISVIQLTDQVRGFAITQDASGVGALQPLALAYDFDVAEVAGDLRFVKRGQPAIAVVPSSDLAAYASQESRPGLFSIDSQPTTELPRESNITFLDPDRDWQANTAVSRRQVGSANNNLATTLPIVLDVDQAAHIADRALWSAWHQRQKSSGAVDDRWIAMEPGRCYLFETPAGLEPLRITRRQRGANGVIKFEASRDRSEVYQSSATGQGAAVPENPLDIPGPTELILLDVPILLDADDNAGLYFGVVGSGDGWRGADVIRAISDLDDFTEVSPVGFELKVGDVTIAPTPSPPAGEFDDVSVITVQLRRTDMVLSSVSDGALDAGSNACFIGNLADTPNGEILQFGVATQIAPGTWELTHLLRGRKGTEFAIDLHGAGETFVLLQKGVLKRANFGVGDLNQDRLYKAASLLLAQADAETIHFTNTGAGLRPYSPADLDVGGVTGDDLSLSWTRRSRLESGSLGEADERYTLRIMDAPGTTIVREEEVTEPEFTYTAAMQTIDFGGPVSDLRWRVAQISATYGNGVFEESNGPVPTVTGT